MVNLRKGKELKGMWCTTKEFKNLIDALQTNDSDIVKDIIFEIYNRGDLK